MTEFPRHMPWPHLYRVTLMGVGGETRVETVLSWLGEKKAIAMAVEAHASGWFGPKKTWGVGLLDRGRGGI